VKLFEGVDPNWTPPFIETNALDESVQSSRYLGCSSNQENPEDPLDPFIEDMSVLQDPTTQSFLHLEDNISVCVDSISGL